MPAVLDFDAMVGTAPPFRDALAKAAKAARSHSAVLIEGESGTGKEMLVRAVHAASPRAKTAYRMINIAGVPANSLESVLFGHEKGAFAGAFERQVGAMQHCDGGTLVLDEVDRLSPELQDRLAEALAMRQVRPSGPHTSRSTYRDSASNLPLADWCDRIFPPELLALLVDQIVLRRFANAGRHPGPHPSLPGAHGEQPCCARSESRTDHCTCGRVGLPGTCATAAALFRGSVLRR